MHGTITAVYQKASEQGKLLAPCHYHICMKPCGKPKPGPYKGDQDFEVSSRGVAESYQLSTLGWMIAAAFSLRSESEFQVHISGCVGYKSLVSPGQSVTLVGALPLLREVAHEWPTILTAMLQVSQLKRLVVGQDYPAVKSFYISDKTKLN